MSERRVPEIRFEGFEEEWEKKELCKCGLINPKSNLPNSFEYVDLESVFGTSMIGHRLEYRATAPSRAQRLARKGDIFYQMVRPYQKNNYLFELEEDSYVFSTGYAQIRPVDNGKFIFSSIQQDSFVEEVLLNCTGTSYPSINSTTLSHLHISLPKSYEEQESIGKLFLRIDDMLEEAEKEIEGLERLKQSSLEKMFPREGERTPEIRFEGFEGEWKIGELKDLLEINDSKNQTNEYTREDVLSVSNEFGLINQIEYQGRSFAGQSLAVYKITHKGQVIYTKSPLKDQPFGIVKSNQYGDGLLSPLYAVYDAKNGASPDFIHYFFEPKHRLNNYLRPLINKGAKNTLLISDDAALHGSITYPSGLSEQLTIGVYFRKLDILLEEKRRRVAKLRKIKMSLLGKMFV